MAIPLVKSLQDVVDFSQTVQPFIPQLKELPQQILENISDPQALKTLYLSTNPLISAFALSLFLAPIFLIVSEVNKNYSQVDRFWSLLPTMYNVHYAVYAHATGLPTRRLDILMLISTVWSFRLTFNYWRKGGYSVGSEDYRWEVLREYINAPLFFIFNILFISIAQSVLLFSVTMPAYVLLVASKAEVQEASSRENLFPLLMIDAILLAYFADQQQWNYQNAKKEYQKSAKVPADYQQEDLDIGFNTTALWSVSRHPNFAAEQSFWIFLYMWSSYVTDSFFSWTIVGPVAYMILFQASTWFTELLSAKKYPEYQQYQRTVGKFLPKISLDKPGETGAFRPESKSQ